MIGKELSDPAIVPENVYNMDETGVLLSVLSSLKVLVSKQDLKNYRRAISVKILGGGKNCLALLASQTVLSFARVFVSFLVQSPHSSLQDVSPLSVGYNTFILQLLSLLHVHHHSRTTEESSSTNGSSYHWGSCTTAAATA